MISILLYDAQIEGTSSNEKNRKFSFRKEDYFWRSISFNCYYLDKV